MKYTQTEQNGGKTGRDYRSQNKPNHRVFTPYSMYTYTVILFLWKNELSLLKWVKKSVVQQPGLSNPLDEVTVDRLLDRW